MRISVVVPVYISRKSDDVWKEGDAVYDHPTELDKEGTLRRLLQSIDILDNKDFDLIVIISTTTPEINKVAYEKIYQDLKSCRLPMPVYIFTELTLNKIRDMYREYDKEDKIPEECFSLLNIRGYPNVRNLCLFVPYILGNDVAILIDDDEVFGDPKFIDKATEFIGKRFHGKTIDGVAGYYLNVDNTYYDKIERVPWMTYWDRFGHKTEAFDQIIGKEPRIKETPFAFGGLMVIHQNLFKVVPFDPNITRGEDIDYLINAKIFGFNFFLDNELSIKHLPPPKTHPIWKRIREDIVRFQYEKTKIDTQFDVPNLTRVTPGTFYPYPGHFLDDTLEQKIFNSNVMLATHYLSEGDAEAAHESMRNIFLAKEERPEYDVFSHLLGIQRRWKKLLRFMSRSMKAGICMHLDENRLDLVPGKKREVGSFAELPLQNKIKILEKTDLFAGLSREVLEVIADISLYLSVPKEHVIFKEGSEADGLYVIITGEVSLISIKENQEHEVTTLKKFESIGEMSLISKGFHSVRAVAEEESLIMHIRRADFEKRLIPDPALAKIIYKNIALVTAERLRKSSAELIQLKRSADISAEILD